MFSKFFLKLAPNLVLKSIIDLKFAFQNDGSPAQRAAFLDVECPSHALDTETMAAFQLNRLAHDAKADRTIFFLIL